MKPRSVTSGLPCPRAARLHGCQLRQRDGEAWVGLRGHDVEDLEAEPGAPSLADWTWMRADAFLLRACRPTSARLGWQCGVA